MRTHLRLPVPLIAVALVASLLVVASCGDDTDVSSAALDEETIARADFIQDANAICARQREEMKSKSERIFQEAADKPQTAAARELIEKIVAPGFEREVEEIRELEPPPDEEAELEEVLVAIEEMVERTRADLAADRGFPYRKTEKLAAAFGLPDCGTP